MDKIEKILNIYFFLALNLVIIILTETLGHGMLFYNAGIIHFIAIAFVALAVVRIFYHRNIHDPILQNFVKASVAAMAVFAFSHLLEFVSFMIFHTRTDAVYANVVNLYLMSILLIIVGEEMFLSHIQETPRWQIPFLVLLITILGVFTIYLVLPYSNISLSTDSIIPYVYTIIMLIATGFGLQKARQIAKYVGLTRGFINYLSASIVVIGITILTNIYYDFLVDAFKTSEYQVVYLSHFAFYTSLSLLFLSFGKFAHLGGMLDEIDNTSQ